MVPLSNHLIADDVKGLVFDCDGTLLNTMPIHWKAWCSVCKDTGLNFSKEDFYVLAGVPGKKIISVLAVQQGKILDAQEVYDKKKNYFLSELSSVGSIPCVLKYVYEANQRGIPVAVASGSSKKQVQQGKLDRFFRSSKRRVENCRHVLNCRSCITLLNQKQVSVKSKFVYCLFS